MRASGVLIHGYPTEAYDEEFMGENSVLLEKYFGKPLDQVSESESDTDGQSDTGSEADE